MLIHRSEGERSFLKNKMARSVVVGDGSGLILSMQKIFIHKVKFCDFLVKKQKNSRNGELIRMIVIIQFPQVSQNKDW